MLDCSFDPSEHIADPAKIHQVPETFASQAVVSIVLGSSFGRGPSALLGTILRYDLPRTHFVLGYCANPVLFSSSNFPLSFCLPSRNSDTASEPSHGRVAASVPEFLT